MLTDCKQTAELMTEVQTRPETLIVFFFKIWLISSKHSTTETVLPIRLLVSVSLSKLTYSKTLHIFIFALLYFRKHLSFQHAPLLQFSFLAPPMLLEAVMTFLLLKSSSTSQAATARQHRADILTTIAFHQLFLSFLYAILEHNNQNLSGWLSPHLPT